MHSTLYPKLNLRGFTLVELLIVIAIISILAMIGFTVYNNVQNRARDAKRRVDINSIASAMETNYSSGVYSALAESQFSTGAVPVDPSSGTNNCQTNPCKYCVRSSVGNCASSDTTVAVGAPAAGITFIVCTNLESGSPSYYCRRNTQ